ncbi:tyrosine-type recombinase/integrase [Actinomadura rupiterrae]|uniref:tyrosine-type recombinase/integrase n=1 Tax=Actinomadura rupiterrae TaxID=559627 RepID=UPI0020A36A2B|nr:tyrosine-type recombinase/integrase [Actinomadura rupiterrae]MCP2343709.1 integrase [Actinomadura rupiterrae]
MAPKGSTFKSCSCRDETGKKLGRKCQRLNRPDGRWSSTHGRWNYQLELPPHADGTRRSPLRRAGYANQTDAEAELNQAKELLNIAANDQALARQIADLITTAVKTTKQLPSPEEVRRKVRTGQHLNITTTLGEYLPQWLQGRKTLRESSRRSYASNLKLYLIPSLGHIRIDRLRVADVDRMFEEIDELNDLITRARETCDPVLRAQVKGRRRVGAATKQRIRATLRSALKKAIREGLTEVNVASLVELPSGKAPKALVWTPERIAQWRTDLDTHIATMSARRKRLWKDTPSQGHGHNLNRIDAYVGAPRPSKVMVWTPALTKQFLERAELHRWYALYYLIAFRGLRRGEACGLRWTDVDLDVGTVTIRWQIIQIGPEIFEGQPKSDAGEATISLDTSTVTVLRTHRAKQNAERLAAGDTWHDTGLVFTDELGRSIRPNEVTDQFERLAMETGLPPIRLHDLRHGAASFLLAAGHDMKTVQETLRLSSIAIAADTYTSLLPQLARQSAEDAAAIILNAEPAR